MGCLWCNYDEWFYVFFTIVTKIRLFKESSTYCLFIYIFASISFAILNTYKTVFSDKTLGAVMAMIVW